MRKFFSLSRSSFSSFPSRKIYTKKYILSKNPNSYFSSVLYILHVVKIKFNWSVLTQQKLEYALLGIWNKALNFFLCIRCRSSFRLSIFAQYFSLSSKIFFLYWLCLFTHAVKLRTAKIRVFWGVPKLYKSIVSYGCMKIFLIWTPRCFFFFFW